MNKTEIKKSKIQEETVKKMQTIMDSVDCELWTAILHDLSGMLTNSERADLVDLL